VNKENVIKAYLKGLETGLYEEVVQLFAPSAIVHSPLYGRIEAERFYKELFSDTQSSKITLKTTFISPNKPDTAAAHFIYSWTMQDGSYVQFECVDIFEFAPQSDKIASLTIIYDTYHTRKDFARVHNSK
jgi:hypothetical protein